MAKLKDGTRVHVEFDGIVNARRIASMLKDGYPADERGTGFIGVVDNYGIAHMIWNDSFMRYVEVVTVTAKPDPESWPPRIGDIWAVGGQEYVTRPNGANAGLVVVETIEAEPGDGLNSLEYSYFQGEGYSPYHDLDAFKMLNPVLMRRR